MPKDFRIGLIVPSSNVTMETEIPLMLQRRSQVAPETFTFHSSRMRMRRVTKTELVEMDSDSDRCAVELSDARCDALAYACLIAVMAQGPGYHVTSEARLSRVAAENGAPAPVVSSAGALVRGIQALGARRVAMIAPYVKSLTALVIEYLKACGIEVTDAISLEVPDNLEVAQLDPMRLIALAEGLDRKDADAVVLSACVQLPSLPAIQEAEDRLGLPVLSAASATVYDVLNRLGLRPVTPGAGRLLSGAVGVRSSSETVS
jgi:maleate isomerase